MTTTAPPVQAITMAPHSQIRVLHELLGRLGVASPFGDDIAKLTAAERLTSEQAARSRTAATDRHDLARQLAAGDLELDDETVDRFERVRRWHTEPTHPSAASVLVDMAITEARHTAGRALHGHASSIFDALAAEAKATVQRLHDLPAPPSGLWGDPDYPRLLARHPDHQGTLSVVTVCNERFDVAHQAADLVRDPAGHGYHTIPHGAPRAAHVYRQWRKWIEARDRGDLASTKRDLRLWRATVDGLEPGVWTPQDVPAPTDAEQQPGSLLQRLGEAVFR